MEEKRKHSEEEHEAISEMEQCLRDILDQGPSLDPPPPEEREPSGPPAPEPEKQKKEKRKIPISAWVAGVLGAVCAGLIVFCVVQQDSFQRRLAALEVESAEQAAAAQEQMEAAREQMEALESEKTRLESRYTAAHSLAEKKSEEIVALQDRLEASVRICEKVLSALDRYESGDDAGAAAAITETMGYVPASATKASAILRRSGQADRFWAMCRDLMEKGYLRSGSVTEKQAGIWDPDNVTDVVFYGDAFDWEELLGGVSPLDGE